MADDSYADVDSCAEHRRKSGLEAASDNLKCAKECTVATTCELRLRVLAVFNAKSSMTRCVLRRAEFYKELKS